MSKLYYLVDTKELQTAFRTLTGDDLSMEIDGVVRQWVAWDDWMITTRIDAAPHWATAWRAIACHRSQLPEPMFSTLAHLAPEQHQLFWGRQCFYRAYSLVNGGRAVEQDLFAGLA